MSLRGHNLAGGSSGTFSFCRMFIDIIQSKSLTFKQSSMDDKSA